MRRRKTSIFVVYFLFQHLMGFIYLSKDSKLHKTRGVTRIKFAKSSRASSKWAREGFLRKYLIILFSAFELSRLKINVLEDNN